MKHPRPNGFCYRLAQIVSWVVATFIFKRTYIRNELRGKKGPFVVLANHQAALDFVNLIGATSRPMTFVISRSFFSTLPIQGFLKKMGVIPKQQFQTTSGDLKKMRSVVDRGDPLVIYPAGLMCEDGLSTPIPRATYKFIKWMNVDIYVARTQGTYFVMPKWAKGLRPGRTTMDIYKLFSKEELQTLSLEQIREKADAALLYDAYREQEQLQAVYHKGSSIRGLENVLYMCPHCGKEFTVEAAAEDTLRCRECGFEAVSDRYGFLTTNRAPLRYVSDWSRMIQDRLEQRHLAGEDLRLSSPVEIRVVDGKKNKFVPAGHGTLTICQGEFTLEGRVLGEEKKLVIPAGAAPILPFSPGKHLELQEGSMIYRCLPEQGALVMKFIHLLKLGYAHSVMAKETV